MGPAAAAIVRLKTEYRYHFLLKSRSRERMNAAAARHARPRCRAENPAQ